MKNLLVTGATGLVGSHLIAELLRRNRSVDPAERCEITAVAHSETSWNRLEWLLRHEKLDREPYRKSVAALEYIDDCRQTLADCRPDTIFHCAAQVAVGSAHNGEQLVSRNVEITHNLATTALEMPSPPPRPLFVHVSSIAALGHAPGPSGRIDERAIMENLAGASPYARSKFLSENEVWRAATHGLPVVIVNPAVIVGLQAPETGFWLNGLFRAARKGANRFWLDGETAFVAATDVARAMVLLAENPESWGKRYILSAENLSFRRFLGAVAQAVGRSEPTFRVPRWLLKTSVPLFPSMGAVIAPHTPVDGSAILSAVPFRYTELSELWPQIALATEKI